MSHARYQAPLAVPCPSCPARSGQDCRTRENVPANLHSRRKALVGELPDEVKDDLVAMVADLKWLLKTTGGVESAAVRELRAAMAAKVATARALANA